MNCTTALSQLKALGNEKVRERNYRNGAGTNQFGVLHGNIRKIAKTIKADRALAMELWETGNLDAQLLAILILKPGLLTADDMDRMVQTIAFAQVADWFNAYLAKEHPAKELLRQKWMASNHAYAARAGWSLTAGRIARAADGLDIPALLNRIESDMGGADPATQWTMNTALANIGIHFPAHRQRAIAIGETLGLYHDYPVAKGCTSPFAPIWIREMVSRQT